MAKVTMLFGRLGAGKTTLARRLERDGAVRLSLDEFTIAASGSQTEADQAAVERMVAQLMRVWPPIVAAGVDVVLDLAFWKRAHRDQVRQIAREAGAEVELVWIDCDTAERKRRCIERSKDHENRSYLIGGDGFDWIEEHRAIDELERDEPHTRVDTTPTS